MSIRSQVEEEVTILGADRSGHGCYKYREAACELLVLPRTAQ